MKKINTKNKNGIVFENFFKFLLEKHLKMKNVEHNNAIRDYDIKANGVKFEIKSTINKTDNLINGIDLNHSFDYLIAFVYRNEKLKYVIFKKEEIKEKINLSKHNNKLRGRVKSKDLKDINNIITDLQDIFNYCVTLTYLSVEELFNLYFVNQLIKYDLFNFYKQYKDLISSEYNLRISTYLSKNAFLFQKINKQLNRKPYLLMGIINDTYYVRLLKQSDYSYIPILNKTICFINGKYRQNKGDIFNLGISKNDLFEGTLKEVLETYGKKEVKND